MFRLSVGVDCIIKTNAFLAVEVEEERRLDYETLPDLYLSFFSSLSMEKIF